MWIGKGFDTNGDGQNDFIVSAPLRLNPGDASLLGKTILFLIASPFILAFGWIAWMLLTMDSSNPAYGSLLQVGAPVFGAFLLFAAIGSQTAAQTPIVFRLLVGVALSLFLLAFASCKYEAYSLTSKKSSGLGYLHHKRTASTLT